jgi:integrase/recombinase XerD
MTKSTISPLRQRMIEDMNARNLCDGTQRGHIRACKRFTAFLKRSPDTAEPDDIRRFQLHLMEDGASIQTRNRTMTGVRFLFRVTLRRHDLAAEVYHIKEPLKLPLTLSREEALRLITVAGAKSLRLRLMLALGYGCGLRAGEVVRLKAGDIDRAQGIIRVVQSKGRKDRYVMLPDEVLEQLRQWWRERPTHSDAGVAPLERLVFPGRKPGKPLTTRQLNRLFHEACEAAGIQKRVTLHSLRHSFATHLLDQGTDIRLIQAVLGHDKLDTTARYTRVATGRIAIIASPLSSKQKRQKKPKKNGKAA